MNQNFTIPQNIKIGKQYFEKIYHFEFLLKNQINKIFIEEFGENWMNVDNIKINFKDKTKKQILENKISLGFWTGLFHDYYGEFIWYKNKIIKKIFPYLRKSQQRRQNIFKQLELIRKFRNKVFHFDDLSNDNFTEIDEAFYCMIYGISGKYINNKDKTVIIINGPSGCGKSTICKEICKQSNNKFVHLQIDEFKKLLFTTIDKNLLNHNIGREICDNIMLNSVLTFTKNNFNIIIDTIFDGQNAKNIAEYHIKCLLECQLNIIFVGIECNTEERLNRFYKHNNNILRNKNTMIEQNNVFELCKELYNISFDSAILSSKEIAKKILNFKK